MYYQPDDTWRAFKIPDREEYVKQFVLKGNFHSQVHKDVIDSYKTAEYLMAHAYYHYPLYDEVFKKLLVMTEMAIKLRCEEVGIALSFEDKKGKKRKKILKQLIDDLAREFPVPGFINALHNLRERRNFFAHPERNILMGVLIIQNIIPIVNIINKLFLPGEYHVQEQDEVKSIEGFHTKLPAGLFVLKRENKGYLIYNLKPVSVAKNKEGWIHFWQYQYLTPFSIKELGEKKFANMNTIVLKGEGLLKNGFKAIDVESNENVEVQPVKEAGVIKLYDQCQAEFNKIDEGERLGIEHMMHDDIRKGISKYIYENCWGDNTNEVI